MTKALGLTPLARLAGLVPLAARAIAGAIMAAHGSQKLSAGPGNFGTALGQMGVPLPGLMGYVVTLVELVGGVFLIVGLLSRLAALLPTINLAVAILLVKTGVGFLSPMGSPGVGAELDPGADRGVARDPLRGPREALARLRPGHRGGPPREHPDSWRSGEKHRLRPAPVPEQPRAPTGVSPALFVLDRSKLPGARTKQRRKALLRRVGGQLFGLLWAFKKFSENGP